MKNISNHHATIPAAKPHITLYVKDQARNTAFYAQTLFCAPALDGPGMTGFNLADNVVPGLMPEAGIRRLLGDACPIRRRRRAPWR